MRTRRPLNLSRQFLLASFPIVIAGMLIIGWYVGRAIERAVTLRIAAVTSLYVDSFIAPHVGSLAGTGKLGAESQAALDRLLTDTPLGKKIVAFKIWSPQGRVLYSTNPALIGRDFPIDDGLREALAGHVHSDVSDLDEGENEFEKPHWDKLIETYSPIRSAGNDAVLAVAEFYQTTDELMQETRLAQTASWLVVACTMAGMYLLLFGVVRRGSQTIASQRDQLTAKLDEVSHLATQNHDLGEKIRLTALRTTSLNEKFLRRISTDLHDGAAQDLALGLMRFETLAETCGQPPADESMRVRMAQNVAMARTALQSALRELRATCTGLQVPDIERMNAAQVVMRAVEDFQRKTGSNVALSQDCAPGQPAEPVKVAIYRLIQEALGNGMRHGAASRMEVEVSSDQESVKLQVRDDGCGFDPGAVDASEHLGLAGMRERVELLRGSLTVSSAPGQGTVVCACLPMAIDGYSE